MSKYIKICGFYFLASRYGVPMQPYINIIDIDGNDKLIQGSHTNVHEPSGILELYGGKKYKVIDYAEYTALILLNPLFKETAKIWINDRNTWYHEHHYTNAYVRFPNDIRNYR